MIDKQTERKIRVTAYILFIIGILISILGTVAGSSDFIKFFSFVTGGVVVTVAYATLIDLNNKIDKNK